jgi:hypothetical protein
MKITIITKKKEKLSLDVPRFSDLTVRQYKAIIPFIAKSGAMDILRYISVTTGTDYKKSLHFEVKNLALLNKSLGTFLFIAGDIDAAGKECFIETNKIPEYLPFDQNMFESKKHKVNAVGYRILLEQFLNTDPNFIDLYLFMAAAVLKAEDLDFDYEGVMEAKERLEDRNAYVMLSVGAFFFYRWKRNESGESRILRALKRVLLLNMRLRSPKLVLIDSANIKQSAK